MNISNIFNNKTHNVSLINEYIQTQSISLHEVLYNDFISIGNRAFLFIADRNTQSSTVVYSKIYEWDGISFSLFQELPDSEYIRRGMFFTIGDSYFLATAAVITDSGSVNLPSNIYKWNGNTFEVFQSINGPGISYMYKFDINTDSYLAVLHTKDVNGITVTLLLKLH